MGAGPIIRRLIGLVLIILGALFVLSYGAACNFLIFIPLICESQMITLSFGSMLIIVGFVMML